MISRNKNAEKVLTPSQLELKPLLEEFNKTHFLVGGTAIALELLHRKSLDFDLFTMETQWTWKQIFERIQKTWLNFNPDLSSKFWFSEEPQEDIVLFFGEKNPVKVQFVNFNRDVFGRSYSLFPNKEICWINTLDIMTLWGLKCFSLMYRTKRKDIVDLYFIINKKNISLEELIQTAYYIFGEAYDAKYTLNNICQPETNFDKTEQVEYIIDNPPKDSDILYNLQQRVYKLFD